ncbi:hypothetical protein JW905_13775, partial [bacterium]|nr:hypothetical protein [candidate division CSSED10-310 bacterium]
MRQSTRRNGAPPPDRDTLLADELGTRRKNWGVSLHVALAYPNTYAVGMSNLGFHLVYRLLNDRPDCLCERVFLEPALVARSGEPITLESGTPLGRFHMLAFAMAFENDYPHLLTMLAKARIPLQADGRDRYAPLVLAGGIAVTANPEPLAPFLDLVVLGDAEAILPALMDRYADLLAHRASRRRTIDALAQLPGVYDPAAFTPRYHPDGRLAAVAGSATPRRQLLRDFTGYPALGPIRTPRTIFSNFALVDVCRGCPRTCRFCMVRGVNQPFRFRRREDLMREIVAEVPAGVTIGLVGASLADLPGLDLLCTELLAAG